LEFVPQEATGAPHPTVPSVLASQPIAVTLEDARAVEDPSIVGTWSDNDDRLYPLSATNDVLEHARTVLLMVVQAWGIEVSEDADFRLEGKLTRFFVSESDQAVGSMYRAEVGVRFSVRDKRGDAVWSGGAVGDAGRYGKSRKMRNANEVLSDALKEAYANILDSEGLHRVGTVADPPLGDTISPADLLVEVVELQQRRLDPSLIIAYVQQRAIAPGFRSEDLIAWKEAGVPDAVLAAALGQAQPRTGL
jgi:hypothetical protein